ncbi:MAG: YcaO-like family protein [Pseudomonadota bacterium]
MTLRLSKSFTEGTHRSVPPEATYRRIAPLFEKVGITRLADITGLDKIGVPVFNAIRPDSRSLSVSQGKGIARPQARVSAAMESIELYHAETIEAEIRRTSYRELLEAGEPAVDPIELHLLASESDGACREIAWIEGYDLIQERATWVPFHVVCCDLVPETLQDSLFMVSSNGLASGNHRLEAISHAICEVIERDATALHDGEVDRLGQEPNLVDLQTIACPHCRELLSRLEAAGLKTYLWDQTVDVAVPSFGCAISEASDQPLWADLGTFHGFGCHVSKDIAVSRALTEAIQSRLTYISGARDDLFREDFALMQSDRHNARWTAVLGDAEAHIDYRGLPSFKSASLEDDIAVQLNALSKAGFGQVVITDLTKPSLGIPVVRATIPGMIESLDSSVPNIAERVRSFRLRAQMVSALLSGDLPPASAPSGRR